MNLGKLNEENEIATTKIPPSNEEPSVLSRSRKEEMMQKLSLQEKEEINRLPTEDLHSLKSGMYQDSLRFDNVTRHGCRHKVKMQEDTLQVLRNYLQKEHMKDKCIDLPNEWKLYTMCHVPQQDTTNTTYCGELVCMYCDFILNDCKLDFKQDDITNSDWRDRVILSILLVKPTNEEEKNNDDKVTLSAIKMKWNNKQKNIVRASAWSTNLIMNKDCKANKDDKMDCNDNFSGGLDRKNKRVQKCLWRKVEVSHTKDCKGRGLFAVGHIDKDNYVIEYVGKIEYKRRENNYIMKINGMNLWINGDKNGGPAGVVHANVGQNLPHITPP